MPEITREQMVEWLRSMRPLAVGPGDFPIQSEVAIIDAILSALEGPGVEERKRLDFIMSRTCPDNWDGEKYLTDKECLEVRNKIRALIMGERRKCV